MRLKSKLGVLGLSATITLMSSTVHADPNAVKPFTASELPIMSTTPNLIYGTYGPQIKLDAPTFSSIPHPIYIDKELEAKLAPPSIDVPEQTSNSISVDQVEVEYNSIMKRDKEVVEGQKSLTTESVKELTQSYLTKSQQSGYLSDAVVTLKGNVLHIAVTPLALDSVEVQAEDKWQEKLLTHLLRGVKTGDAIDMPFVEKQLRLIQANPDLSFSSTLEVIPFTHKAKIKITSSEHKQPLHIVASGNNLDQIIFGRYFGALTAVHNNITGHGDSLMLSAVRGFRSTGVFSRYEIPIKPQLRAYVDAQFADIEPYNVPYTGFGSDGMAYRISPGLRYVVLDKPDRRLSADINFDFKQSNTRSNDDPIEREAVRTFRGGINYDQKWEKTTLSMRHELAQAVPIFSGSLSTDPRLSWYRGGSQFFRYTGYATAVRQLPLDASFTLNTQWQYSPDGLSNFDVGGIGGTFYGRGYREVFIFADTYAVLTGQYQIPAKFIPKGWRLPFSDHDMRDTTSVLTFVDYAYGDATHTPAGIDGNDHILSTGFGIRSQITNRISGRLDVGFPLLRQLPFRQGARLHFGIDTALF